MKSVIFDFDGTIADTLPVAIECAETVLGDLGLTDEKIKKYKNMTVKQLISELNVPYHRIPKYVVLARSYIKQNISRVKVFSGLSDVIKRLHDDGHHLYIVSSNSVENINILLMNNNLNQYFESIVGGVGVFGKTIALKSVIKKYKIDKKSCIYIGDEVRDIKASNKVGLPVISVTWGFNGDKILSKNNPDFIAEKPKDIIRFIQNP
ncbi:MAG TPA: HAD hydrolase-like protein [Candidatus Saccharibacteria bacterium]|nr:HAD hydrolase-like protein [Candidatus Saccharibacteria bacterium]